MKYLIWSNRHREWWRAERSGYTMKLQEAGNYTREEAAKIMLDGLPGSNVAIATVLANSRLLDANREETQEEIDTWRML